MTLLMIKEVMKLGDCHGSSLRDMMSWLKICDLGNVSDKQAQMYIDHVKGNKEYV